MDLIIRRFKSNNEATLGRLFINNVFECYTLEDQFQEVKVKHETRIPDGIYNVKIRTHGRWHESFKRKFPMSHKGMLEIADVPGFTDILIHTGNTDDDSSGCILVGVNVDEKDFTILPGTSTPAYLNMYKKVIAAIARKEEVLLIVESKEEETTEQ
ncbi:MAG: hypothetical protein A2499_05085 [Stygiobacter sp. RIFOXYC12_FULL_38_8]|nr:MAG: hypothetical protein A2299_16450 [Stygiobacter sp. RIFOXYB2_FULL_37_11]OGV13498.1 MAG: hypothetical protein A2237_17150 [Stygiobacter sp. RIFOXYA2_FULL_38_8]OGV14790.1 MAG: hypothetical protein A2440_09830 [Stygiobacter sp. RIFOXYC2_FULL_38_25]OGV22324.1 MAG: hypothetical protein A2499_05085 [Stygiobacter sp. RIFOXYC12_FULL_38_8]OGV79283.1 MAG: hypothetical protein A2X65_02200 [Stygiobacter sp. GWF2_38_21]